LLFALAGLVLIGLAVWLIDYLLVGQYFVSTDDAYIAADTSMIAAKVDGYVTAVPVLDNQVVAKGDALATIDNQDYTVALAGAQADMAADRAALQSDQAQLSLQQAKIAAARAAVTGDQAKVAFAADNQRRYAKLSGTGASTAQDTNQADTDLATAQANLAADQANLLGAVRMIDVLNAAAAQSNAALQQAAAHVAQAELDLGHTQIRAPFDGVVGNKTVAVGDYLQSGTQIMAIVPLHQVYVIANFKETQITRLAPGQRTHIVVDGFPDLKVTGTVASISPASGQEFALLPPDNATGNFTKIVQRVPVKIWINLNSNLIGKLRPGMSVEPDIDTRNTGN
jgi:membrane fusion protein (multidrug efflux system)